MASRVLLIIGLLAVGKASGKPSSRPESRIEGGTSASISELPYNVIVFDTSFGFDTPICAGAIYSPSWVITAGSCVTQDEVSFLKVSAGNQDITNYEGSEQDLLVSSFVLHEEFDAFSLANDIALLQLSEPLEFNENVGSISLPPAAGKSNADGDYLLSGWGNNTLQKATVSFVSDDECSNSYPGSITPSMMCAQGTDGDVAFCRGDEGAPLRDDASNLVGIASWTYACEQRGFPMVFTEIAYYVDWIESNAV